MPNPWLSGEILFAADLNVIVNAWATWSPTLTNITLGNGTLNARHRKVGKTVEYLFAFTMGSTSAMGTGPTFTLPVAPHSSLSTTFTPLGGGFVIDAGTTQALASVRFNSGSTVDVIIWGSAGTNADPKQITATVPMTWTTNDLLVVSGIYETT